MKNRKERIRKLCLRYVSTVVGGNCVKLLDYIILVGS